MLVIGPDPAVMFSGTCGILAGKIAFLFENPAVPCVFSVNLVSPSYHSN
jgi:hypothetical protein